MTSVKTFNDCMDEFLSELKKTFPDRKIFSFQYNKFYTLKKTNPRQVVERFMLHTEEYRDHIIDKDERPILENKIPFLVEMDVKSWWSECSEQTKQSIWKYLNTLLFIGNAINSIPEDMMEGIEKIAKQCAESMQDKPSELPNFNNMMSNIQNMMGPIMNQSESSKVTKKQKLKTSNKK